jgi:hypothetical protein
MMPPTIANLQFLSEFATVARRWPSRTGCRPAVHPPEDAQGRRRDDARHLDAGRPRLRRSAVVAGSLYRGRAFPLTRFRLPGVASRSWWGMSRPGSRCGCSARSTSSGRTGVVHASGSALRRSLLALLALRTSETVSAEWLLDAAWDEPRARVGGCAPCGSTSRSCGRELPDARLIETPPRWLRAVPGSVRHRRRRRRGVGAHGTRSGTDPVAASSTYERALAVWRGDELVDAAPCVALEDEARRLTELRLSILGEYFASRLASGAGAELVPDLSPIVCAAPAARVAVGCAHHCAVPRRTAGRCAAQLRGAADGSR